jgi:FdhD protein
MGSTGAEIIRSTLSSVVRSIADGDCDHFGYDRRMAGNAPRFPTLSPGYAEINIERRRGGHTERVDDCIAAEVPIALRYNGRSFAVMMATPQDLEDFALGFSLSEGLIESADQLLSVEVQQQPEGIMLSMRVPFSARAAQLDPHSQRLLPGRGSCGICGTRELEDAIRAPNPVVGATCFSSAALEHALKELEKYQPMNAATGALHAAAWADAEGHILLAREDIGRHNALDKLIGALYRANLSTQESMLLLSSRASYEMITKAARARIGFVAAISAPTALAIEIALRTNVCLVGFTRPGSCNVYTYSERLQISD